MCLVLSGLALPWEGVLLVLVPKSGSEAEHQRYSTRGRGKFRMLSSLLLRFGSPVAAGLIVLVLLVSFAVPSSTDWFEAWDQWLLINPALWSLVFWSVLIGLGPENPASDVKGDVTVAWLSRLWWSVLMDVDQH